MTDPTAVRNEMRALGITMGELAAEVGMSASHVGKQLRGNLPLQRRVQRALGELIDRRVVAWLPHVARLLRREGEPEAAEVVEAVWERLRPPRE